MRRVNVLIVDNDPAARPDLRELLSAQGHTVVGEAESGTQALALARNLKPDLVLLDVVLVGLSGLDVARTLAEEMVAPVLLVTGSATAGDLERVDWCGAMGFLSKPLREADLGPLIQIAVARWRKIVELESEIRNLNERIEARKLVGRAKAILMERHNLPEREAFRRIQAQSISLNKPVHEIARAIITASEMSV